MAINFKFDNIMQFLFTSAILAIWISINCPVAFADDFVPKDTKLCGLPSESGLCKDHLSASNIASLKKKMASQKLAYTVETDALLVMVDVEQDELTAFDRPYICCEVQGYLDKVANNRYAAKFRWNKMAEANLDLNFLNLKDEKISFRINGDAQFAMTTPLAETSLITLSGMTQSNYSYVINPDLGTRDVTVIKGSSCLVHLAGCVVVYMPDGESLGGLVANSLANRIDLNRFVFVGIHNSKVDVSSSRIEELLYGYMPERFGSFMRFTTSELRQKIENSQHPALRFVAGFSNGGAWALDALIAKPDLFDGAIAMSPAQWKSRNDAALSEKVVFVGAGLLETNFYRASQSYSAALKLRGAKVREIYVPSGHGMNTWLNIWNGALKDLRPAQPMQE